MKFNVIAESIDKYLESLVAERGMESLGRLLSCALSRSLRKELANQAAPTNLRPIKADELGVQSPGWLRKAFDEGKEVYTFAPSTKMKGDISHIADWIHAALVNQASWLEDVDDQNRPRKLLKFGTIAQAKQEADRNMLLAAQIAAATGYEDESGHEVTVKVFDNGFRIVQLLTPEALDKESGYLGHCVGEGAYDHALEQGTQVFYSLRDVHGKGHATMRFNVANNGLLECKGKQNEPPVAKYMPYILMFVNEKQCPLIGDIGETGMIEQDGTCFDIMNLPGGLCWRGDLNITDLTKVNLLTNLHIEGDLLAQRSELKVVTEGVHIGGSLVASNSQLETVSNRVRIKGDLVADNSKLKVVTEGVHIGGSLSLGGSDLETLSEGVQIGGDLLAIDSKLKVVPKGMHIGGSLHLQGSELETLSEGVCIGINLVALDSKLTVISERVHIGGCLIALGSKLKVLSEGVNIVGSLYANGSELEYVSKGVRIGGNCELIGTAVKELPEDLQVGGIISLPDGTQCTSVEEARVALSGFNQRSVLGLARTSAAAHCRL